MPYQNELADKTSHIDIVKNPDVEEFLNKCHKIDFPGGERMDSLTSVFMTTPLSNFNKPKNIISIDGSYYESSVTEKFPSRKIGFIKVGVILLKYNVLDNIGNDFVHGDLCLPNLFVNDKNEFIGFIDVGNCGKGDKYYDYSWLLWSFEYNLKTYKYNEILMNKIGINKNIFKIKYNEYIPIENQKELIIINENV